jgi:hypothetical protein
MRLFQRHLPTPLIGEIGYNILGLPNFALSRRQSPPPFYIYNRHKILF